MILRLTILIGLILLCILYGLYLRYKRLIAYKTVSAGNISSRYSPKIKLDVDVYEMKPVIDEVYVNPKNYDIYVVRGNSMKNENIENYDFVFVSKLSEEEKRNLNKDSILVLEIDRNKDIIDRNDKQIEFKLRKFCTYINSEKDFENWFDENKSSVSDTNVIKNKYNQCVEKYRQNNSDNKNCELILSSTYDVKRKKLVYSFHPMKFLNGVVKHVIAI